MTTADEDRIALRQSQALSLRIKGHSFREIAAELGISVSVAHSDVRTAMSAPLKRTQDELDAERELELHRCDVGLKVTGRILADETLDPESELKLKALDRQVKLQEQRAKLLGLYAPAKQEVSGPEGAPIAVDNRGALLERIASLVAGTAANGTPEPDPGKSDG